MNAGATALAAKKLSLSKTVDALGAVNLKVSRPAVAKWLSGASIPSSDARKAIERAFGIAPTAWEEVPAAGPTSSQPSLPSVELLQTAAAKAEDLLARIEMWRGQAEFDNATAATRSQLATLELRAIEQLARLTGQQAPPESSLLKSPHWTRLSQELLGVLEEFPEALRKVVAVLGRRAAA